MPAKSIYAAAVLLAATFCAFFVYKTLNKPIEKATNLSAIEESRVLGVSYEPLRGDEPVNAVLPPIQKTKDFDLSGISASAFAVIDDASRSVLIEKDPHLKLPIASLTKLMTISLAYEHLDPYGYMTISAADTLKVEPSLNFFAGEEIKIQDLMEATLVCSANDAARALANEVQKQHKTGESFVELMNQKAKELGLLETNFSNPIGFDSEWNFSSVKDLERLVYHTQNYAIFKSLGKKTQVEFSSKSGKPYTCRATNKLVGKGLEIEAIKTGYTPLAQGSIIAKISKNNKKLLLIVIGSQDREKDLVSLSKIIFDGFTWQ